jgi:hypothetical protein
MDMQCQKTLYNEITYPYDNMPPFGPLVPPYENMPSKQGKIGT